MPCRHIFNTSKPTIFLFFFPNAMHFMVSFKSQTGKLTYDKMIEARRVPGIQSSCSNCNLFVSCCLFTANAPRSEGADGVCVIMPVLSPGRIINQQYCSRHILISLWLLNEFDVVPTLTITGFSNVWLPPNQSDGWKKKSLQKSFQLLYIYIYYNIYNRTRFFYTSWSNSP